MKLNQKVRYAVGCLFELSKHLAEFIDAEYIASNVLISLTLLAILRRWLIQNDPNLGCLQKICSHD